MKLNKLLIFGIILILFTSSAIAADVSIKIFGTNKTNSDSNATAYGGNNTIEVQAWNTSYVKNLTVNVANMSGDTISFNISNVTANTVHEVLINGSSYNGYLSGANGMLNFSVNQTRSNKTYVIRPAQNLPPGNISWSYQWRGNQFQTVYNLLGERALATVYQNTNTSSRAVTAWANRGADTNMTAYIGMSNPPNLRVAQDRIDTAAVITEMVFFYVPPGWFYTVQAPDAGTTLDGWIEVV